MMRVLAGAILQSLDYTGWGAKDYPVPIAAEPRAPAVDDFEAIKKRMEEIFPKDCKD